MSPDEIGMRSRRCSRLPGRHARRHGRRDSRSSSRNRSTSGSSRRCRFTSDRSISIANVRCKCRSFRNEWTWTNKSKIRCHMLQFADVPKSSSQFFECGVRPVGEVDRESDRHPDHQPLPRRPRQARHQRERHERRGDRQRRHARRPERALADRDASCAARSRRARRSRTRTACRCSPARRER